MSQNRLLQGIDWMVLILGLIIVTFGIMNVYSVNQDLGVKQMIWFGLGMVMILALIIASGNNRNFFEIYSPVFYIISVLLLVGVLLVGKEINGAKAWYRFGPLSLQPAEFAKIGTALLIANFLNHSNANLKDISFIGKILLIIGIPVALILLQPDLGSVIIFCSLSIALYREGLNPWIIITPIIGLIVFLISIVQIPFYVLLVFGFIVLVIVLLMLAFNYTKDVIDAMHGILVGLSIYFLLLIVVCYFVENLSEETRESFGHLFPMRSLFFSEPIFFNTVFFGLIGFVISMIPIIVLKLTEQKEINNSPFKTQSGLAANMLNLSIIVSIVLLLVTSIISFISPIIFEKLPKHQKERVMVLYEGEAKYRDTSGYNLLYAKTAIGSGELYGKGYNQGTIKKGRFVPEQQTDYIFTTVGEEWGFLGSTFLVLIYAVFVGRLFYLAEIQKNRFARFYGYCVASILFFHFFINIAMVIGLFPTVGIPLPFFSYGGSSLWGFTILIGIFLIIHYKNSQGFI
ncbi:rod shape determining protein RodA [Algoriella xinjiangensis]|uniref:Cell wall polymerase n=2 Tax=Weeksellaceae TaxID=2762318 RepID=A0A1I4TFG5_9FLAO|nr:MULTISPECIES: rod shape-determining protein RodA [Algoriella]MBO6213776.1 rod shape-determining protein RodA [Algoriella sp.]SFM75405.1 rod shape determining protein RodA [Algoriella xinjiangensis]